MKNSAEWVLCFIEERIRNGASLQQLLEDIHELQQSDDDDEEGGEVETTEKVAAH